MNAHVRAKALFLLVALTFIFGTSNTIGESYYATAYYPIVLTNGRVIYDLARISDKKHSSGLPYEVCTIGESGNKNTVLCLVEEGEFTMGSTDGDEDEKPVHSVRQTRLYYVSKFPTSNAIFEAWPSSSTRRPKRGSYSSQNDGPATQVKWSDASEWMTWYGKFIEDTAVAWTSKPDYIAWLASMNIKIDMNQIAKIHEQYSLPTEAEYEKASQGKFAAVGSAPKYPWGDTITEECKIYGRDVGLTNASSLATATVVPDTWNSNPKNEYGRLKHMTGNIFTWCSDWYLADYYKSSPASDPTGPTEGKSKVMRGGTWYIFEKSHRVADRSTGFTSTADEHVGFRVVRRLEDVGL